MKVGILGLFLVAFVTAELPCGATSAASKSAISPPTWPSSYELEYTITMPLTAGYMSSYFSMPVHVWFDWAELRLRIDVYNGLGSNVWDMKQGYAWWLAPQSNEMTCIVSTPASISDTVPLAILPNITGYTFAGSSTVRNSKARIWQSSSMSGTTVTNNLFYVSATNGRPLRFTISGGDEYVFDFKAWRPGPVADSVFNIPTPCVKGMIDMAKNKTAAEQLLRKRWMRALGLLPSARTSGAGPANVDILLNRAIFVAQHNKAYHQSACTNGSYLTRPTYKVGLNQFAHMTMEQFTSSRLGLHKRSERPKITANQPTSATPVFERTMKDEELPASLDYRGTGFDGPGVKDQMSCGSCWAFSTVGALQGAWYKATGLSLSFSEQQLMDCSWNYYGNMGCAGGWQYQAMQYVAAAGGIVQEGDLPYRQEDTYCATGLKKPGNIPNITAPAPEGIPRVNGFLGPLNITTRDEKALMEALVRYGPVSVAIDAGNEGFMLYTEGVYYNATCGQTLDELDHGVLVVGYGTTDDGIDYWIVKNSWSKLWGMDGYIYMARKGNDCGITTWPIAALVNETAAAEAVGAMKGLAWAKKAQAGASRRMMR